MAKMMMQMQGGVAARQAATCRYDGDGEPCEAPPRFAIQSPYGKCGSCGPHLGEMCDALLTMGARGVIVTLWERPDAA